MSTDEALLDEAIDLAREALASDEGGPFGAVVAMEGRVVGRGRNRVLGLSDPTAHAEILALREAAARLGTPLLCGAVLYASSEPCPMCLGAAWWARVDRIVYAVDRAGAARAGFDDARFYAEFLRAPDARQTPQVHLPRPGAEEVLLRWARRPDARRY